MLEIRPGRDSDKPQILTLIGEVFGPEQAERAERRWHWQWHEDPRLETPGFHAVVAEWNGRVIANLSGIPAGLYLDGQPMEAYWYADVLVHWGSLRQVMREQKRGGSGPGPNLSRGIAAVMLDHPAAGRIQMGKHLTDPMIVVGYKSHFRDHRQTGSWARLISFRQPLERLIGKPLAWLLGGLADGFLPGIPTPGMEVSTLAGEFDSRFDQLWDQARIEYPAITRRDSATLNWRYRQHPDLSYQVLTVEQGGEFRGYLVYSIFHRHQQRRAYIVDVLVGQRDTVALEALIASALRRMRGEAVHKVECYAGAALLITALERLGFKARLHGGKTQATLVRGLPDVELYVTRGDGDGG